MGTTTNTKKYIIKIDKDEYISGGDYIWQRRKSE